MMVNLLSCEDWSFPAIICVCVFVCVFSTDIAVGDDNKEDFLRMKDKEKCKDILV